MKIGRDKIVAEALLLLNEIGLDRLTTRALAVRLGVAQPALYWHFKNRRDLLDAMNDAMMAKFIDLPPPPADTPWQDYLFAMGQRFRQGLLAYRDGARVHAGTPGNPQLLETSLTVLTRAGLTLDMALQLNVAIGSYTVGWVLEEQAEPRPPAAFKGAPPQGLAAEAVARFLQHDETTRFETGLRFLIDGAAASLKVAS